MDRECSIDRSSTINTAENLTCTTSESPEAIDPLFIPLRERHRDARSIDLPPLPDSTDASSSRVCSITTDINALDNDSSSKPDAETTETEEVGGDEDGEQGRGHGVGQAFIYNFLEIHNIYNASLDARMDILLQWYKHNCIEATENCRTLDGVVAFLRRETKEIIMRRDWCWEIMKDDKEVYALYMKKEYGAVSLKKRWEDWWKWRKGRSMYWEPVYIDRLTRRRGYTVVKRGN